MSDAPDHGPCISGQEYDRRITALQEGLPAEPSRTQLLQVRRAELDLAIDHRLGVDFPEHRRDALWATNQRVSRRRWRLFLWYVLRRLFAQKLAHSAKGLAGHVIQEYSKVLSERELQMYFGPDSLSAPSLPVDTEHLMK